jgi:hypothetical protein
MISQDNSPTAQGSGGQSKLVALVPVSAIAAPVIIDDAALTNTRWELFAQHVAAGHSLADARRHAGYSDSSRHVVSAQAGRLASLPAVRARIAALREAAAELATISIASRMAWLDSVVSADMYEVERVVACPCPHCWPDDATLAVATQRYLDALGTPTPLPPPDTAAPRVDCPIGPHRRIETTPTAELSGAARAAYRGARYRTDGSIEVLTEDRAQCADLLNKMQGVYVTRTENKNLNINASVLTDEHATPDALLASWKLAKVQP